MSRRRGISSIQLSAEILEYCPKYKIWDEKARLESKERIHEHLQGRKNEISKCVEAAMVDIQRLGIEVAEDAPVFRDDDSILNYAAQETDKQIAKWDGVQIKQCKKLDKDGKMIKIDTWQKFAKKAKNHQDQTSWKISGDYFFAPYIGKARCFIEDYCQFILNSNETQLCEIRDLANLAFANALFDGEIKFHRTKPKPLIRHRTLAKSNGIHIELEKLYPALTVRQFIQQAKNVRKERDGKSNIIAGEFFVNLRLKVSNEYNKQKQKVYAMFNLPLDIVVMSNGNNNNNGNNNGNGMFDDNKDTDIDDDDHSNRDEQDNDQDIDMMNEEDSDSASLSINNDAESVRSQPQSQQGVNGDNGNVATSNKNKRKKKKAKRNQHSFQSTKMDQHKETRRNNHNKGKRKQNRTDKVEKNCQQKKMIYQANNVNNNNGPNATPPNTLSTNSMNSRRSFDNVSAINVEHLHNDCSDCHSMNNNAPSNLMFDDRTTVSTVSNVTPSVHNMMVPLPSAPNSVSMSPMRIPINNLNNNNRMNMRHQSYPHPHPHPHSHASQSYEPSYLFQADNYQQKVKILQFQNDAMRREIQAMRSVLNQGRQNNQRPRPTVPVHMHPQQAMQQFIPPNMHQHQHQHQYQHQRVPIRPMPIPLPRPRAHPAYQQQQQPVIRLNHQNIRIPARPPPPSQPQHQPDEYRVSNNDLPPAITNEEDEKVLFPDGTQVIDRTQAIDNDDAFTNIHGFVPSMANINDNGIEASIEPFAFNNVPFNDTNTYNQSVMIMPEQSPDISNLGSSSFLNLH